MEKIRRIRGELTKGAAKPVFNKRRADTTWEAWHVACYSKDCENSYQWKVFVDDTFPLLKAYRKDWRRCKAQGAARWYCETCQVLKKMKPEPLPEYYYRHDPLYPLESITAHDGRLERRLNYKRKVREMAFEAPKPPERPKAINPRTKGRMGECEIRDKFILIMRTVENEQGILDAARLSSHVKRASHSAADKGGCDLLGIPDLSVEVKRRETLALDKWWQQTIEQAEPGKMPVLFWRQNRAPWRVRSYLLMHVGKATAPTSWIVADYPIDSFFEWFKKYFEFWLNNRGG